MSAGPRTSTLDALFLDAVLLAPDVEPSVLALAVKAAFVESRSCPECGTSDPHELGASDFGCAECGTNFEPSPIDLDAVVADARRKGVA